MRTWRKGAAGERRTARMLRPLNRRGYTVLHDRALPYGRANVDHLLVGPGGLFVVDTKNWDKRKRITRRGRRGYVRVGRPSGDKVVGSVIYEAGRVSETLSRALKRPVEVAPVVAIHGAAVPLLRVMRVSGVPLLRASQVPGWISRQKAVLSVAEVAALSAAAEELFPPYVE
ncbi:nuclease-related domain-containing protein [Streptosporangium sp. NPDC006013]|uniref:nuclease-related domain-containing protein n=1 Tax=Streptosporangium sp. NPDC006013 TaxID=3155596 RepID=UPI0033BB9594